jgi:predicted nucleic acid-binding protein
MDALPREEALASLQTFRNEWADLVRIQITEFVMARADTFAWEHGLRGYDAVHLAAASIWQDAIGEPVTLATFDLRLWKATARAGLARDPTDLPTLLERWKIAR